MTAAPRRSIALGTTAAAALLLLVAPAPAQALRQLRDAGAAGDPTTPLVALLSLLAWTLAAWLALTVLLTACGHLPGLTGRACAGLSQRVAPVALRRTVEVALGLTVAVGTLGGSPALAAPGPAGAPGGAPAVSLDWAAPAPPADSTPQQDLDWPGTPASAPAEPSAESTAAPTAQPTADAAVVVRPGDTLWDLAAHELAEQRRTEAGSAAPTDAEVAQTWPSWWAANRDAIGDDPDLIQPGTHLLPPPASS